MRAAVLRHLGIIGWLNTRRSQIFLTFYAINSNDYFTPDKCRPEQRAEPSVAPSDWEVYK